MNLIQFHGPMEFIDLGKIMKVTRDRNDFNGMDLITNFVESKQKKINIQKHCISISPFSSVEKPACWMEPDGSVHGLFKDALEVAACHLNLTLNIQKTLQENRNIWFKK